MPDACGVECMLMLNLRGVERWLMLDLRGVERWLMLDLRGVGYLRILEKLRKE